MKQNSGTCRQINIFWLQMQTCQCKLLHQGIKVLEPFTWSPVFALQSAALSSFWCTYQLPGLSLITSMYLSPRNNMDVQYNLDCWYLKIPDWSVNKAHRGANVHLNKRSLSGEHKLIIHRSVAEPLSCTSAIARRGFLSPAGPSSKNNAAFNCFRRQEVTPVWPLMRKKKKMPQSCKFIQLAFNTFCFFNQIGLINM